MDGTSLAMEQPVEITKNTSDSRATEIEHDDTPVTMTNAISKLTLKPNARDTTLGISAQKWSFEQFFSQKKLLGTITQSSLPWTYTNTWSNVNDFHFRGLGTLFRTKSWKLHFRFEIISNFQEQGMDMIYFCNVSQAEVLNEIFTGPNVVGVFDLATVWQLPHRKIMLGEETTVDVELNWISPFKGQFDDRDLTPAGDNIPYHMGTLVYRNMVPRTVATGVTASRQVRIYSWVSDVEYSGYAPVDTY